MNRLKVENRFMRWKERKKNNRGSSLVLVIVAMAIITLLVTMVLSLTVMNYRMKYTNLNAQKNFYTVEEAMDEIRQGLAQDLSLSSSNAYLYVMSNYNDLPSNARYNSFCSSIVNSMRKKLTEGTGGSAKYNPEYLAGMLTLTKYDSSTGIGATVSSVSNENALNVSNDGLILKNVVVSYYGKDDYFSQIQTDIVLSFPEIAFEQQSEMPDLLNYSMVANDSLEILGTNRLDICGNVYMGKNGAVMTNARNINIHKADDVETAGTIITNKGISMNTASSVTFENVEIWADSILVDGSKADIDGNVYLNNDLVMDNNLYNRRLNQVPESSLTMSGELWAYGNPDVIGDSASMLEHQDELTRNPADYSSSIIMNGPKTTLDLQNLSKMIIGGEAYVGASKHAVAGIDSNTDVLTGESIAVKANQTAYLIPPECVAPGNTYGGMNPMPASQFNQLVESLTDDGKKSVEEALSELVSYDVYVDDLGSTLANIHVNGYQREFYSIQNYGNMVYLFMKFDSQSAASDFTHNYFNRSARNYAKLADNLALYQNNILIPSALGTERDDGSSFYCNGAIVAYGTDETSGATKAKVYASDELNRAVETEDYLTMMAQCKEDRDVFSAMQCKLTRKYYALTQQERTRDVYDNLVYEMAAMSNSNAVLGTGSEKKFASETIASEKLGAIVINNKGASAYELTDAVVNHFSGQNEAGVQVSDARLCVVIASGDVKVSTDFKGLIFAGGKILFDTSASNSDIEPDPANVALALNMMNGSGVKVGDYLVGSQYYTIGGLNGDADSESGAINYLDQVTYENWKKQ